MSKFLLLTFLLSLVFGIAVGIIVGHVYGWSTNMTFDWMCEHNMTCQYNFNNSEPIKMRSI